LTVNAHNEPLDDLDSVILSGIRDMWRTADPMPASLLDRVRFAVQLENVELEVLRLIETQPAAARGDEQSQLITFDSDTLTIMVSVKPNPDGTIRLDGWVTPADRHPIELRGTGGSVTTESDEDGRFVLDAIPQGMAQLVVRPNGTSRTVTTPSICL
jgi:hypothetical protein